MAGATAVALCAACGEITFPRSRTLATGDLLVLPLQSGAPTPASLAFYVANSHGTTRRLVHADGFNTLYVEVAFPSGALAALDGTALGPNDSVLVTLTSRAGEYGLTLAPGGLTFVSGREPLATFAFATYADASVADGSSQYASRGSYLDALTVWQETSPELWRSVQNSGASGTDEVQGILPAPGRYVLAAPR